MSDTSRPRASLRTAVVWEVLKEALDRRVKATGRDVLDVLDTGGGTGKFAVPVARLGHRVTVVDPSPNALFGLERRVAEAGVADLVRGVQGDAQGLLDVVEQDAYDVVLCHGVLEYVDDPAEGVANAVAALRAGGTLSLLAAGLGGAVLARAGRALHGGPYGPHRSGRPLGLRRPGTAPVHRRAALRAGRRLRPRGRRGARRADLRRPRSRGPGGHRARRGGGSAASGGGRGRAARLPRGRHPAARPG